MPDRPAAEIVVDERLVRALLSASLPQLSSAVLRRVRGGWDCEVWRVGDELALRVPRRELAAPLIRHEQYALAIVGDAVGATGVRVPTPIYVGEPSSLFGWPWSLVPWVDGTSGLDVPRAARRPWAAPLASALVALHDPAPRDAPRNPYRGVPLVRRDEAVQARLSSLGLMAARADVAAVAWRDALAAAPWSGPNVWIHGDLHPGNLVVDGSALRAIIDFGDVTAGDPAYDLATAWLTFDAAGRADFVAATGDRYAAADWVRARGWAAAVGLMLLAQSDDDPVYRRLGTESIHELSID